MIRKTVKAMKLKSVEELFDVSGKAEFHFQIGFRLHGPFSELSDTMIIKDHPDEPLPTQTIELDPVFMTESHISPLFRVGSVDSLAWLTRTVYRVRHASRSTKREMSEADILAWSKRIPGYFLKKGVYHVPSRGVNASIDEYDDFVTRSIQAYDERLFVPYDFQYNNRPGVSVDLQKLGAILILKSVSDPWFTADPMPIVRQRFMLDDGHP